MVRPTPCDVKTRFWFNLPILPEITGVDGQRAFQGTRKTPLTLVKIIIDKHIVSVDN
jgi:hypothetical protein